MSRTFPYKLFQAFGIEIEYMIVDRENFLPKPVAHELLRNETGGIANSRNLGPVTISNELATHVIELKTTVPSSDFAKMESEFQTAVVRLNRQLEPHGAMLVPGAMHPFMDPRSQSGIWPHGDREIYRWYDEVFDCHRHGWLNLQSCHMNLPFADEAEFALLHDAIILLLPVLPALSASSPYFEGGCSGYEDTRMFVYAKNQKRFPLIAGSIVPEIIDTEKQYIERILRPAYLSVRPYDPNGIVEPDWLNSRGAIARFDRGAIEIRILDTQECPACDLAICHLIVHLLRQLTALGRDRLRALLKQSDLAERKNQLMKTSRLGGAAQFALLELAQAFELSGKLETVSDFWRSLMVRIDYESLSYGSETIRAIIEEGSLAHRLLARFGTSPKQADLEEMIRLLGGCLQEGRRFAMKGRRPVSRQSFHD